MIISRRVCSLVLPTRKQDADFYLVLHMSSSGQGLRRVRNEN